MSRTDALPLLRVFSDLDPCKCAQQTFFCTRFRCKICALHGMNRANARSYTYSMLGLCYFLRSNLFMQVQFSTETNTNSVTDTIIVIYSELEN